MSLQRFELQLLDRRGRPAERHELTGNGPECVFLWAEHNARGRRFEMFEDGRSLGIISSTACGNVWTVEPPGSANRSDLIARSGKPAQT